MKNVLFAIITFLLLCGSAQAYELGFDPEGNNDETAANASYEMIDGWQLVGRAEAADGSNTVPLEDMWTFQDVNGDFTEDFTLKMVYGERADNSDTDYYDDLYIDVHLEGNYDITTNTITFDTLPGDGYATIYLDGDTNLDYVAGSSDIEVATLSLSNALAQDIQGSSIESGLSLDMDLSFMFDSINTDFFEDDLQNLVTDKALFTFAAGRIVQTDNLIYNDNGTIGDVTDDWVEQVSWTNNGIEATFQVVPEPTTMVLFGIGLLGIAGVSRKRYRIK